MGLLDAIDRVLGTRIGLLVNDPRAAVNALESDARAFNQASLLATQAERNAARGLPVSPEQLAAKQYIDRKNEEMAMGFAGTVGSGTRSLPLGDFGEITRFSKPLPSGNLYRETSSSNLMNMFKGDMPFGAPTTFFSEVPEMALGQGSNKGVMIKVGSEGLRGRPYLDKPGLEQSYLQKAGEFEIKEQPSRLVNAINEVWVSPQAYQGMRKIEKIIFDKYLKELESKGVKINKVEKLPNVME